MYRADQASFFSNRISQQAMRAETQNIVDEIRQAITLLRRHL